VSASNYVDGDIEYRVATREDEPRIRSLLARIETGGHVRLSFRREPDAFASLGALAHGWILARETASGADVGLCERVVRRAFVDGARQDLPYLAGLRVVPDFRNRLHVLRGGFEAVRRLLAKPDEPAFAFTSIMSDNAIARRVLGANLRGMPRYEPIGDYSTFAMSSRRGEVAAETATAADLPGIAELLLRAHAHLQFASAWDPPAIQACISGGTLRANDFLVIRREGRISACAALWDPSSQRQIVVAGYSRVVGLARPLLNVIARLGRRPLLPAPGAPWRAAYFSHVAVDSERDLRDLLSTARTEARRRGIDTVLAGFGSLTPNATTLRMLAPQREFRSRLYLVRWPQDPSPTLDTALPASPELAHL